MKKYIVLLCVLLCFLICDTASAQALGGRILNAEVNTVAVATATRQFNVPVVNGAYELGSMNEDFSLFVKIPAGASIAGAAWAVSDNGDTAWITLPANAQSIPDLSFTRGNGSIAISAFQDDNANGQRGKYELSVPGIQVDVLDAQDNVVASGVTAMKEVLLNDIPEGEYRLRFDTADKYFYTTTGTAVNALNSITGSADGAVSISMPIMVRSGEVTHAASAVYITSSMEGRVWLDENNNGTMEDTEPGFQDIQITAVGKTSGREFTATVEADGHWSIHQLPQDTYILTAEIPEDYLFAIYSLQGRELRSVFTPFAGQRDARNYHVKNAQQLKNINIGVVQPASVEVKAFFDSNHNGALDEGEIGVSGVVVELIRDATNKSIAKGITDADGVFTVPAIRENSYRVRAILPQDGSEFSAVGNGDASEVNLFENAVGRRESSVSPVNIKNQQKNTVLVGVARMLNFGGRVYVDQNFNGAYDEGEKLLPNVVVRVLNAEGEELYRTRTDARGVYRIPNLYQGAVKLEFGAVKDHMYVRRFAHQSDVENYILDTKAGVGYTDFIHLVMGEDNENVDAGVILSGSISGRIFEDLNDNGLEDDNQGFEGVEVALLDEEQNVLFSTTSDSGGNYFFEGVLPNTYRLRYTLPDGAEYAEYNENGNTFQSSNATYISDVIPFRAGDKYQAKLGGAIQLARLSGKAFVDNNANGVLDMGEQVIGGLRLELNSANQKQQRLEYQVQKNGSYVFENLRPGQYALAAELPEGYIFSNNNQGFTPANRSEIQITQRDLLQNAAINIPLVKPASLRTSAWLDEDLNGTKSANDGPYSNVSFYVEYEGQHLQTLKADENGMLHMENLRPGSYRLGLILQEGAKAAKGFEQATLEQHSCIVKDFQIKSGDSVEDKGYGVVVLMSIRGKLWIEEKGEAKPQSGIEITLYNQDGKQASTVSGENGEYAFENLNPGEYYIVTQPMPNSIFVQPGDPNFVSQNNSTARLEGTDAVSKVYTLKMPHSQKDVNVISIIPAVIGDLVWFDSNENGLQDVDEPAIQGVQITLVQNGVEKYRTTSDGNGFYSFSNVYPGEYQLAVSLAEEFTITQPVPQLPQISSVLEQVNGKQALSAPFELKSGDKKYYIDIGLKWQEGFRQTNYNFGTPTQQDWSNQVNHANEGWGR